MVNHTHFLSSLRSISLGDTVCHFFIFGGLIFSFSISALSADVALVLNRSLDLSFCLCCLCAGLAKFQFINISRPHIFLSPNTTIFTLLFMIPISDYYNVLFVELRLLPIQNNLPSHYYSLHLLFLLGSLSAVLSIGLYFQTSQ